MTVNQGLKGLTISSIAEKVSVSEANLYRHFKNKKEILAYAVESIGDGLKQNLKKIKIMRTKNPVTLLKKLFNLHLEYIETNEGIPHLVFSEELHKGNPDMRNKLFNAINTYAREIELLMKKGQEAGIICSEIDTHAFSFTMIGMVQISTIMWLLNNCSSSLVTDGMKLWNSLEKCLTVKKK
ncbi:MAG: TetR/AcrR family transcriptional regulator [Desulfobacteraceae bacterium]|nr:TetR/AcrR family transcriptional regulator [Desulfobacteraceae bacterium]MBU4054353.1 TetR/AcrR family transcriptional regulator [Pseudomonadota bacterium]